MFSKSVLGWSNEFFVFNIFHTSPLYTPNKMTIKTTNNAHIVYIFILFNRYYVCRHYHQSMLRPEVDHKFPEQSPLSSVCAICNQLLVVPLMSLIHRVDGLPLFRLYFLKIVLKKWRVHILPLSLVIHLHFGLAVCFNIHHPRTTFLVVISKFFFKMTSCVFLCAILKFEIAFLWALMSLLRMTISVLGIVDLSHNFLNMLRCSLYFS